MAQQEYCMYLISRINECDEELRLLAKSNIQITNVTPVPTVYYENYLVMRRKNYIQRLAANCNLQFINPKYFKKYRPINKGTVQPTPKFKTTTVLRPVAKPFYPNNTVDTSMPLHWDNNPVHTVSQVTHEHSDAKYPMSPSMPPPLEDCDESPNDYQKPSGHYFIEYILFDSTRCYHGIYCPGYNGFYECSVASI